MSTPERFPTLRAQLTEIERGDCGAPFVTTTELRLLLDAVSERDRFQAKLTAIGALVLPRDGESVEAAVARLIEAMR
jgi:hypothetical protein